MLLLVLVLVLVLLVLLWERLGWVAVAALTPIPPTLATPSGQRAAPRIKDD